MPASVSITWGSENNNLGDHYNVYRSSTSPVDVSTSTPVNTTNIPATTNTYVDTGLEDGTYYYVVEAVDANANTELTPEYTVTVNCAV